jgi:PPP family 3-phenylpropionic acid transporter
MERNVKKASAFTFYLLYYAAIASLMPFVVLYYQQLGFTGAQIGLLAGMAPLITLVGAPLWTGIADTTRRHRLVMSLTIAVAVVLALIFPLLKTLGPVILLVALVSFFGAPITSLSDSATMSMLAGEKEMYGRVRLGGTIGWGLAAPVAGMLIQTYGLKLAFWGYAALMFLALVVSQRFVFGQRAKDTSLQGGVRTLLANRRWVLFLAMAFVGGMSATAQGLFGAMVFGFGAAAGGFIGGLLLENTGGRGMYLIFGVIVLVSVAIIALIERRLPTEQHG